jgi:hypothetical protein
MARAIIPTVRPGPTGPSRARKRQYDEQRPVLQLPLESPSYREPEAAERREDRERERERGIAVIDFYI